MYSVWLVEHEGEISDTHFTFLPFNKPENALKLLRNSLHSDITRLILHMCERFI